MDENEKKDDGKAREEKIREEKIREEKKKLEAAYWFCVKRRRQAEEKGTVNSAVGWYGKEIRARKKLAQLGVK